ncbi:hypothetical protein V1514DRAFT_326354 [Lipomyces japonicus]|uniref:uncharacterized protein n=1 Tax=Lipomyces japonicus TaxID=56871 RepID=UPI0034CF2DB0
MELDFEDVPFHGVANDKDAVASARSTFSALSYNNGGGNGSSSCVNNLPAHDRNRYHDIINNNNNNNSRASLLDMITNPPILYILSSCLRANDLRNLKLLCTTAWQALNLSPNYFHQLANLTIKCFEGTYMCSDVTGFCYKCHKVICQECTLRPSLASTQRFRLACDQCGFNQPFRGRCQCGLKSRWICRSCHLRELELDRTSGNLSGSSVSRSLAYCYVCHAQMRNVTVVFPEFHHGHQKICSWCNKWGA